MTFYRTPEINSSLFGAEAILAYQENRTPEYDLETLKLRFPKIANQSITPVAPIAPMARNMRDYNQAYKFRPIKQESDDWSTKSSLTTCLCIIL